MTLIKNYNYPAIERIINLIPQELRDDKTGDTEGNTIYINEYVKFSTKVKTVVDHASESPESTNTYKTVMTGLVLKAGPEQRRRAYSVDPDKARPVSYHFWTIVKSHTELMRARVQKQARDNRLQSVVFAAAKPYISSMEAAGCRSAPEHDAYQGAAGTLTSFTVGHYTDPVFIRVTLSAESPKLEMVQIKKHLSPETLSKILALIKEDTSQPVDLMNTQALSLKKERKTLFD
jgi:hypothetical protein